MGNWHETRIRIATWLSLGNIMAGLTVLAGWQFRVPILKGASFGTFVSPAAALLFILSGISILLQLKAPQKKTLVQLAFGLAGFVTVFAAATCIEYLFNVNFGIDRLVMAHRLDDWNLPLPGRFAVSTAIGFTLAGISLFTLRARRAPISEGLACLMLLLAYQGLLGYLYSASVLYARVMALPTIVLFVALAVSLLCAASRQYVSGVMLSPFAGAVASRRMLVAIALFLPALGLVELYAETTGRVSQGFGTALSTMIATAAFAVYAFSTANTLNETDRKRQNTEAALFRSERLSAAGRLAAAVAHEINNPLEAIANILYLLRNDYIPKGTEKKYLTMAEEELSRVAAIARRTLGFYKDDNRPTVVDLNVAINAVLEIYSKKMEHNMIAVRANQSPEALIMAKGGEVRQILANLVSNAIDAMPGGGMLEIRTSIVDDSVAVELSDTGPGIAREHVDRIFEPFFTTKENVGTGLGLWVSNDLVRKNQGRISLRTSTAEADHGTVFSLTFPVIREKNPRVLSRPRPRRNIKDCRLPMDLR